MPSFQLEHDVFLTRANPTKLLHLEMNLQALPKARIKIN